MSRVAIVLTPGFADWEYAPLAGPGQAWLGLEMRYFGPDPVGSMGGIEASGAAPFEAMAGWDPAAIAVIGGTIWETPAAPDLGEMLRAAHAAGRTIAAICGGTLAPARAGLLDARAHTSNAPDYLGAHGGEYAGAPRYVESAEAVVDDRVVTAPGTAPVSFAAAVFAAAGAPAEAIAQMRGMLAAEHRGVAA